MYSCGLFGGDEFHAHFFGTLSQLPQHPLAGAFLVAVLAVIGLFLALGQPRSDQARRLVRGGVRRVVLAARAGEAVGGDELGGTKLDGVAVLAKLPCTVVGAGTGFHADEAGREMGDQRQKRLP